MRTRDRCDSARRRLHDVAGARARISPEACRTTAAVGSVRALLRLAGRCGAGRFCDAPLGEGSTAFLSFSGVSDRTRARGGGRALTISTHTDVARWERAERDGRTEALKEAYRARLLLALERVLPGASVRPNLVEIATPHTFARYTGRGRGLVGGLPQTPYRAVLGAQSHRTSIRGLYLAGDNTFPGQSTVGATLGALNASRAAAYLA
jgi:phytoene dehydrogenase-like protein